MTNIKMMNHVVLDSGTRLSAIRVKKNLYQYTEQGMLLYPIGSLVPIIEKGYGCIGIATVKSLTMDANSTTVIFTVSEVDKSTANTLYGMYRNNATVMGNNDDPYSNTDQIIPGAIGAPEENLAEGLYHGNTRHMLDDIDNVLSRGNRRTPNKAVGRYPDDDDDYDY